MQERQCKKHLLHSKVFDSSPSSQSKKNAIFLNLINRINHILSLWFTANSSGILFYPIHWTIVWRQIASSFFPLLPIDHRKLLSINFRTHFFKQKKQCFRLQMSILRLLQTRDLTPFTNVFNICLNNKNIKWVSGIWVIKRQE